MDMNGRNVFLTGASSGIGRATAVVFAQAGARVALCARSEDKLHALEAEIAAAGGIAAAFPADVTDPEALEAALRGAAERFGEGITGAAKFNEQGTGRLVLVEALSAQIDVAAESRRDAVQQRLELQRVGQILLPVRMRQAALI